MNWFSKKDWFRVGRQLFYAAIMAGAKDLYDDMLVLVGEAQELTRENNEDKLAFQVRKALYVMRKFIATHDELEEWDDTLSDMMNAAVRDLKGKDIIPSKLKIPKWLKIDIN